MTRPNDTIPVGFCQCGCGARTRIAKQDRPDRGYRKGEPLFYVGTHNTRVQRKSQIEYLEDAETGCWNWQGAITPAGYGKLGEAMAHRLVYERERGQIAAGLVLDHRCRNRRCVNPDHLEPVTQSENITRGDLGVRKLSEDDVREIRRLAGTVTARELAGRFGVTRGNIHHVVHRLTWKHVE